MRILLFIFLAIRVGCAQQLVPVNKFEVDTRDVFIIPSENSIYDLSWIDEPNDTVRADFRVTINGIESGRIFLTRASFKEDTLRITLHQLYASVYNEYVILVAGGSYFVRYRCLVDALPEEEFVTVSSSLRLNTPNFKKGAEIRGYTEYQGYSDSEEEKMHVRIAGNFKCVFN